uniref:SET domain-containing protein n=1 Tax=Magallana gigas TaxID=29159 RepID=A0A8W8MQW7_MAGGI
MGDRLTPQEAEQRREKGRHNYMFYFTWNGKHVLCLFAAKDIDPGEEIRYDYGDENAPWRKKYRENREERKGTICC